MWEAQGETSSTHSLLRLIHENSKLMEKILILLLLVSLFSVGSDVLCIVIIIIIVIINPKH